MVLGVPILKHFRVSLLFGFLYVFLASGGSSFGTYFNISTDLLSFIFFRILESVVTKHLKYRNHIDRKYFASKDLMQLFSF